MRIIYPAARRRTTAATLRLQAWRQVQGWIHTPPHRVRDPVVTHHRVELARLPPELAGLRIAHLSDIHYGLFLSRAGLNRILDLTQALRPDLIALTGDFVTQSPVFIEPVSELLARLRAPLGVFAVLGNHDFRAGADALTTALRRHGVDVLRNAHRYLRHRGVRFRLAGVDDSRQHPDLAKALGRGDAFTLLLAHNPVTLPEAARLRVDFALAGHTHGGQIKFHFAAPLYDRYLPEGFLRQGPTRMYVSRGLGKVILPMRVGADAELACHTLYRAG